MQPQPIILGPSPYLNFQSNQHIIKSLMIGTQKVFYQPNQTIKQIKQQYQQVTQKKMNVQCSNVSIPLETKVQALEKVLQHASKIQQVFTKLQENGIQQKNIQIDNICQQRVNNVKKIDQNIRFQISPTASSLQKQQQADKAKKQSKEKLLQEQQLIVIKENQQGLDELIEAMKKKRQYEEMQRKKKQQWKKMIQRQEAEKRKQQQALQKQRIYKQMQAKIKQQYSLFSFLSPQQTSQPKKPQQQKPSQQPQFYIKCSQEMNFKQFYSSKPPSWTCTINLTNLPERPYYIIAELELTAIMTPKDIVKELEILTKTTLEVELSGAKGVRVPKGRFGWTLEKLGMVKEKELYVANVMKMCFFDEEAVMLQKPQSSSYQPTPIKQITQHPNPKSLLNFMLYDPDHHRTQIADILCFKRCQEVREALKVTVKLEEELMKLECGFYTLFYSEEFQWVSAAELWVKYFEQGMKKEKRPRIWCLSKTYALALAQIYTIQHLQFSSPFSTTQPSPYFTLSTKLSTLILNRIIVHNTQSFSVTLFALTPSNTLTQSTIKTYPQLSLSEVFPNHQHYMLGGLALNKHATLGDYRIKAFKMLFVGKQQFEKYDKNQLIVTEYDGGWYRFGQVDRDEWEERVGYWRDWCMEIHNKQILRLNDLKPYQNLPRLTNIVVGLRGNFQKLYYLKNIHPHFSLRQNQQHILRHITRKDTPFSFDQLVAAILGYCTSNNAYQVERFIEGGYKEVDNAEKLAKEYWNRVQRGEKVTKEEERKVNLLSILACMTQVFNSKQVKKFKGKLYFCEKKSDIAKRFANTQTIILKELKSGFKTQNEAIRHFQKYQIAGTIYQVTVHSAVQTQGYSLDKYYNHILIPPFTCFYRTQYNTKSLINRVCLEQIPMPQTKSDKKIFVIQDTDENVEEKYNIYFGRLRVKYPEIEIIHVKSKVMMNLIIKKFFWMFKILGDKVHIFSVLKEIDQVQNKYNVEQCIDIAEIFINEGLSVEGFIYANFNYPINNKQKKESFKAARDQVQARFKSRKNWKVVTGLQFALQILESLQIHARQT